LDRKFNIFEGFFRNYYFIGIFLIMVGGQALIVEVGGAAFQVVRIYGRDWGISLVVGFMSIPIGALVRVLPTEPFHRFLIKIKVFDDPAMLPTTTEVEEVVEEKYEYNPALSKVKDNLNTFANIRGGRVRASTIVTRSRTARLKKANIQPSTLLAMVPTVIAGTVAAGPHWAQPISPGGMGAAAGQGLGQGGMGNPAAHDPSRSTAELFAGRVQMHPDTDADDPLMKKYGITKPE
jgi:Ca2+-transporting ATPase